MLCKYRINRASQLAHGESDRSHPVYAETHRHVDCASGQRLMVISQASSLQANDFELLIKSNITHNQFNNPPKKSSAQHLSISI